MTPAQLRRGYGPIYRYLSRCGSALTGNGKFVLFNLMERLGENSHTWPSQPQIAEDTGISERSVRNGLRELEDLGFVSSRRRAGSSSMYQIDIEAVLAWAENGLREQGKRQTLPEHSADSAEASGTSSLTEGSFGSPKEEPPKKVRASRVAQAPKVGLTIEAVAELKARYPPKVVEEVVGYWRNDYRLNFKNDKPAFIEEKIKEQIAREGTNGQRRVGVERRAGPRLAGDDPEQDERDFAFLYEREERARREAALAGGDAGDP